MNIDQTFLNAVIGSLRRDADLQLKCLNTQACASISAMANALEAGQQATAPDGSLTAEVHGQYQEGSE